MILFIIIYTFLVSFNSFESLALNVKEKVTPIKLKDKMSVKELIDEFSNSGAFNAGKLAKACKIFERMVQEDSFVALTLAGALIPAGLGRAIATMVKRGLIDFIISTGANLYHDIHFALEQGIFKGVDESEDLKLLEEEKVRIYDICIDYQALLSSDKFVRNSVLNLKGRVSSCEIHYNLGKSLASLVKDPDISLLVQAYLCDLPIYTPSPGDSSIGMNLAQLRLDDHNLSVDPELDVLETTAIVYKAEKNGGIILGGGAPKNFYLQTQPMLSQILGLDKKGHDYIIQISVDSPHYGGLSGATPSEAITWKKVNPREDENCVVVYSDATIAAPLLFSYALEVGLKRELKRLYSKRKEMLDELIKNIRKT
ncbi:Deoxyhypusine synthase-like protein [archaeon HR06]|nr:Deoxyhypusine synthase-like protein [archaeon HR06]